MSAYKHEHTILLMLSRCSFCFLIERESFLYSGCISSFCGILLSRGSYHRIATVDRNGDARE